MDNNLYIQQLTEALQISPQNAPIRLMLVKALENSGRSLECENILKGGLALDPDNKQLKEGLCNTYFNLQRYPLAMVLAEELADGDIGASTLITYARLLLMEKNHGEAGKAYMRAKQKDSSIKIPELEALVAIPSVENMDDDEDFVQEKISGDDRFLMQQRPDVNFSHVGGMEKVKEEIRLKIIAPLIHADLYKAYNKKAGGGVLLYGPPGCGKTHIARATAGETSSAFISIGIHEILDMYIGNSEKNLHEVFEAARRNAPCIIFIDEIDALGASRSDMRTSAGRHLINQFLSELDGISTKNEGILIIGATNAPWHLDAAFRRPGRFDRIIFVPPPDEPAQKEILEILLEKVPHEPIDTGKFSKNLKHFSGADLKAVVDVAVEEKLKDSMRTGKIEKVTTGDLAAAAKKVIASTSEWFKTAKNYAVYANESGLYDDILKYIK